SALSCLSLPLAIGPRPGVGFAPPRAGLPAPPFSFATSAPAPLAAPLARRYGRLVLFAGGVLMALGTLGARIGAEHVNSPADFWPIVPGLAIAGVGLSLLIIPLANVVLAAVPLQVAAAPRAPLPTTP